MMFLQPQPVVINPLPPQLGGPGTGSAMHQHAPAWNLTIYGRKLWLLYPTHLPRHRLPAAVLAPLEDTTPGAAGRVIKFVKDVLPTLPNDEAPICIIQGAWGLDRAIR